MDASLLEIEYDVLLVGTGMVESILAGALARIGKKVLHLDQNDYYGSNYASFSLAQFRQWTKNEHFASRGFDDEKIGQVACTANASGTIDASTHQVLPMRSSFQCQLLHESFLDDATEEELMSKSSSMTIDVNPRLLLASEELVETLITSGVGRYLEFAAIERTYVHLPSSNVQAQDDFESDTVWQVPCSKKDVFQSKLLGMIEKRQLMKFLQYVADYGDTHISHEDVTTKNERSLALGRALKRPQNKLSQVDDAAAIGSYLDHSFHDLLGHCFHLSTKLQQIIVYCVGLATLPSTIPQLSAREGLVAVYRYVTSIGRFAGTAFLTPLYGISELAQSFCRLSAVYGGIYVLRAPIDAFVQDTTTKKVCGVRATDGKLVRAKQVVINGTFAPCFLPCGTSPRAPGKVLRGVYVLKTSLRNDVNRLMLVIPPEDPELQNPFAIQAIQLDVGVFACPKGYVLLHLSTPVSFDWWDQKEKQLNLMQKVVRRLLLSSHAEQKAISKAPENKVSEWHDQIAWRAIFTVDHLTLGDVPNLPSNVWVCETSLARCTSETQVHPLELHLESASANARAIFEAMCPGEAFLPKSASAEQAEQEEQESEEDVVLRAAQQLAQQTNGLEKTGGKESGVDSLGVETIDDGRVGAGLQTSDDY